MSITQRELVEVMAKEIGRLQKLCKANGIDFLPPKQPSATMNVTASVKVIDP
jgi:hypothetical protein